VPKKTKDTKTPLFTKKEILASNQFTKIEKDFLQAFLGEEKTTVQKAKTILSEKLKGVVK